jgi:hypothetical protein
MTVIKNYRNEPDPTEVLCGRTVKIHACGLGVLKCGLGVLTCICVPNSEGTEVRVYGFWACASPVLRLIFLDHTVLITQYCVIKAGVS